MMFWGTELCLSSPYTHERFRILGTPLSMMQSGVTDTLWLHNDGCHGCYWSAQWANCVDSVGSPRVNVRWAHLSCRPKSLLGTDSQSELQLWQHCPLEPVWGTPPLPERHTGNLTTMFTQGFLKSNLVQFDLLNSCWQHNESFGSISVKNWREKGKCLNTICDISNVINSRVQIQS